MSAVKTVIGTGGIFCGDSNVNRQCSILEEAFSEMGNKGLLKPDNPTFVVDKDYLFWGMGLLATIDKDLAIDLMLESIFGQD